MSVYLVCLLNFQHDSYETICHHHNASVHHHAICPIAQHPHRCREGIRAHNTASAAEDFLIYADNQKHMTTIGEPTYGSTGQPLMFELPGGGNARICTKKDTYPDGREFVGYGIQPDIMVEKTLEDYLEGNDPVLKAALEHLK